MAFGLGNDRFNIVFGSCRLTKCPSSSQDNDQEYLSVKVGRNYIVNGFFIFIFFIRPLNDPAGTHWGFCRYDRS